MKSAIILHGMPSKEEYFNPEGWPSKYSGHWLPWIQRQLIVNGILTQIPEMPSPYEPDYDKWRRVFEYFPVNEDTILVGHSCGGGFLVRWLSERKIKVGKVALVAPWINPNSSRTRPGFFDFQIDNNLVSKTQELCLFISSDDKKEILDTTKMLKERVNDIQVKEFHNKGHFTFNHMKTQSFPELKDFLL